MTSERKAPAEVHSISGAPAPHSDDLQRRMRRYLFSMAVRTACVVLAVVVTGPFRWIFIVGAVVLPYVAVVMANAVGGRHQQPAAVPLIPRTALAGAVYSPGADDVLPGPATPGSPAERMTPDSHERSA